MSILATDSLQLHEQTQRFILLLIFYLFGPILTLGIIGGIVLRKLPSNARNWEQSLTRQTGLHWTIQSVEYCSSGFVRLHSVQILDDTAQYPLFHAKQIDVRRVTETQREKIFSDIPSSALEKSSGSGLTGWLVQLFPSFSSSNRFWQITVPVSILNFREYSSEDSALLIQNMLRKLFARLDSLSEVPAQLVFEEIAVISEYSLKKEGDKIEDKVDVFRFVHGNIYRTASEIRSDWEFQIKDVSELDRERLSFALSLNDTLEIAFQTGKQPIPCDLAAVFCSLFGHFSGGSFQGTFLLSSRSENHSQMIRLNDVVFENVPLARLVKPYTQFAVEGTLADLQLQQAVFGTEAAYAEGSLLVQNGAVETALFRRCVGNFQLTVEPRDILDSPRQMIPFSACAIHFYLRPDGIDFWADLRWHDAFMYQEAQVGGLDEMVVRFPNTRRTVTYHELMSLFAPDNAPVVPLTPGTKPILSVIPTL